MLAPLGRFLAETAYREVDGAYDTRKCHDAISARNALVMIPPRKRSKSSRPTRAVDMARNEAVNTLRNWAALSGDNSVDTTDEAL